MAPALPLAPGVVVVVDPGEAGVVADGGRCGWRAGRGGLAVSDARRRQQRGQSDRNALHKRLLRVDAR